MMRAHWSEGTNDGMDNDRNPTDAMRWDAVTVPTQPAQFVYLRYLPTAPRVAGYGTSAVMPNLLPTMLPTGAFLVSETPSTGTSTF